MAEDVERVYAALSESSPQDVADLARASGVGGARLERAVRQLESQGRVEIGYETDQGLGGYSFSYVVLTG